ncbi:small-conductance mechanosensitive channel [Methanolinea mesophila]|uniref:mechanosensitive ion channel family protein n=1 Tax=Methanolinea mesophila TaxID=547055 RepID=UPI001AE2DE17|nr:mechanosensitive ion channel family protein [Methanolinea mesophila]MBP1927578.1 small-conductance mechanosensitive channel [Methanolinea mesophila]
MIPEAFNFTVNQIFELREEHVLGNITYTRVALFIVSLIVAFIVAKIVAIYLRKKFGHRMKKDQLKFFIRIVQVLIFVIAIGIAVPSFLDVSFTFMLIGIVGILVVIAVSSQKVISNFVSGVALHQERVISAGDFVEIGGVSGTVEGIKLFSTLVRTTSGVFIRVPNDQVYGTQVSNYYANAARRYEYTLGIRYEDDTDRAIRLLRAHLEQFPFALKNPPPDIFVSDIDSNSVIIKARVWFPSEWANTRDDISLRTGILPGMKKVLEDSGIELPYAQQVIHFAREPFSIRVEGRDEGSGTDPGRK